MRRVSGERARRSSCASRPRRGATASSSSGACGGRTALLEEALERRVRVEARPAGQPPPSRSCGPDARHGHEAPPPHPHPQAAGQRAPAPARAAAPLRGGRPGGERRAPGGGRGPAGQRLLHVLEEASRGVLLGKDTFTHGRLGAATVEATLKVLEGFRKIMDTYGVVRYRAVATSAIREAGNRETFLDRVRLRTGIEVEVIDGTEENRLTYMAVRETLRDDAALSAGDALLLEVGGGSADLSFLRKGQPIHSGTYALGVHPHAAEPGLLARQPRPARAPAPAAHPQRGGGHPARDAAARSQALRGPRAATCASRPRGSPREPARPAAPASCPRTPSWPSATRSRATTSSR